MVDRPDPKRGEVWWVKPGKTAGAELQKKRPYVVISADAMENVPVKIVVHPQDDRDTLGGLEHAVLERLDPPLNLRHMQPTPVRARLTELRRRISREG